MGERWESIKKSADQLMHNRTFQRVALTAVDFIGGATIIANSNASQAFAEANGPLVEALRSDSAYVWVATGGTPKGDIFPKVNIVLDTYDACSDNNGDGFGIQIRHRQGWTNKEVIPGSQINSRDIFSCVVAKGPKNKGLRIK